jgi:hypothetical protein
MARKPYDMKGLKKSFQSDLDSAEYKANPNRYNQGGERQSDAYPSAARSAPQPAAPRARPTTKAAPPRRPGGGASRPKPGGIPWNADKVANESPGGIPPGPQVGQEPYSDRLPSGFGSLPGAPALPGPLNLPSAPGVSGLTPSVNYPPDLSYGGGAPPPPAPVGPPPGPTMGQPMMGAAPTDAPGGAIPLPGGAPLGSAPSFGAMAPPGPPPPGLLDAIGKYWQGMKSGAMGGQ